MNTEEKKKPKNGRVAEEEGRENENEKRERGKNCDGEKGRRERRRTR